MLDDRAIAEALHRALEPTRHEPSRERIAALQREVRRQRLQRPLRRAAVGAAAALIALMGAAVVVETQNDQRSADAVAITNTRAAIEQVRFAIARGIPEQIERSADALESQLLDLEPVEKAAVDDDASVVLDEAHRVLGQPRRAATSTVPTTASSSTSTTTTSSSTTTSTSTTTTTTSTPTTIPETATTTPAP